MRPRILIAVPVKNAAPHLAAHFALLDRLRYPRALITLAYLESDSQDGTLEALRGRLAQMGRRYRRCRLQKRDMGFHLPPGMSRWTHEIQLVRRAALARSRNHLLSRSPTRTGCFGSMST
jgi:mannan polymerase complexes MNN9 subunit